jgi:hypothetical protein
VTHGAQIPRALRVAWRGASIGAGAVVTDVGSGEDVSHYVPLREGSKLLESQVTGRPVEIDLYLLKEGHPFLSDPETVAARRCLVVVQPREPEVTQ